MEINIHKDYIGTSIDLTFLPFPAIEIHSIDGLVTIADKSDAEALRDALSMMIESMECGQ